LRSVPRIDRARMDRLDPIPGQPPDLAHLPSGCAFRPRCRYAVARCAEQAPPLEWAGEGQLSACWEKARLAAEAAELTA
jgi:oligopeptide/dipeptide ABC transporter ATP-binding protein